MIIFRRRNCCQRQGNEAGFDAFACAREILTIHGSRVPYLDAVEKNDLDLDAGRHLDDWLILFCAFDEILADAVGCARAALAQTSSENVTGA